VQYTNKWEGSCLTHVGTEGAGDGNSRTGRVMRNRSLGARRSAPPIRRRSEAGVHRPASWLPAHSVGSGWALPARQKGPRRPFLPCSPGNRAIPGSGPTPGDGCDWPECRRSESARNLRAGRAARNAAETRRRTASSSACGRAARNPCSGPSPHRHLTVCDPLDPPVGDRHAMRVAGQVLEYLLGAGPGRLATSWNPWKI